MASIRKHKFTRWTDANGKHVPAGTPGAKKHTVESRKWYGYGIPGRSRGVPLATNYKVAETLLARMIVDGEREQAGMPVGEAAVLSTLIDQWEQSLLDGGTSEEQARRVGSRNRRMTSELALQWPRQIQPDIVSSWLARTAASDGWGPQTRNHWRTSLRAFARWLAAPPRRLVSPTLLDTLPVLDVEPDQRRARRTLTVEQLGRLLVATLASGERVKDLTAEQRHLLYSVACTTGFRANELASLTPGLLCLDDATPHILLAARRGKNRRPTRQPIPAETVDLLRAYIADRDTAAPLWPGNWFHRAAEMLRIDLARVGIPYAIDGPDGPLYADFHANRHTYVSLLEAAGVSLRDAMQLARHSDPKLTLARYGKSQIEQLGETVQRMPKLS
jgi:integrase